MAADCVATPCVRPRPSGRGLTAFFWGSPGSLELSPNPDFLSTQRHAVFFPWILTVCGAVQHPLLPQRRRVFPWILAVCGAVNFFRPRILEVFGAGTFLIPPCRALAVSGASEFIESRARLQEEVPAVRPWMPWVCRIAVHLSRVGDDALDVRSCAATL
jgi:hypothetical protein